MKSLLLYALVVIAFLDNFVQLPIISPFAQSLKASPLMIGFVVGMYSFTNLIGNVIAGVWIDKYGARIILITGMAATVIVLLLYTLVDSPSQLVMVRSIHGLTGGLMVPSVFTLISRRAGSSKQGRNMAYSGAAVGIAAVLGPAFGGIVKSKLGINAVFTIVACILAVAVIVAWRLKGIHNLQNQEQHRHSQRSVVPSSRWISLLLNPSALHAYIGAFTLMFTMGVLTYMLPLKIEALLMNVQTSGLLFSTFGLTAILIFILPTNRIFERASAHTTMFAGMIIVGIALWNLSLFSEIAALYSIMILYGIGFALLFPSINSLLVENVPVADRGKAFGLFYAFFSIGVVVGSILIGVLSPSPEGGFLISSLFIWVVSAILWGWRRFAGKKFNNSN